MIKQDNPKIMKKKKKLIFYLATKLGWILIKLLGKLCFFKEVGRENFQKLVQAKLPFLYVLWHGRIFSPIYLHCGEGITAMVSQHADGEMIAQTIHKLGYKTVRGSSTRGGNQAFHDMVSVLKNGGIGTIIPDGPRGPRHHLKPGTMYIAQQTGACLIPVTFSANRNIVFNSWDRFMLPLPFSKNIVFYGKPIKVLKELSEEQLDQLRKEFEAEMIRLENKADDYFRK
ncbi:lysophospholipid acyltransferase family protein [candidate division KSB1 bacterium]|nr:lysophospholipid acyltransferase family protein [candidate division KSB1 bacterium]